MGCRFESYLRSSAAKTIHPLNDVFSEKAGPFTYVRNSHAKGKLHDLLPIEDKNLIYFPANGKVEKAFSPENILTCLGKSGTVILADPSGLHRGGYCQDGHRLAVTVRYTTCKVQTKSWQKVKPQTLARLTPLGRLTLGNYELDTVFD